MLLEMVQATFPERIHRWKSGTSYTYQELFEAARLRAASVKATGASRLVKLDVSNLGTPLSLFSSAWAGVPYVPLNYRLTDEEIEALLKRVTPAYLVTQEDRVDILERWTRCLLDHCSLLRRKSPTSDRGRMVDGPGGNCSLCLLVVRLALPKRPFFGTSIWYPTFWVLLNLPVPAMMKPLWFVFLRII